MEKMEKMEFVKKLEESGLEFRGELTMKGAQFIPGFNSNDIRYACESYQADTLLYFAKRVAPQDGKLGDAGTRCSDLLIVPSNTITSMLYYVMEQCWVVPECKPHVTLVLDNDCHIVMYPYSVGCCGNTVCSVEELCARARSM